MLRPLWKKTWKLSVPCKVWNFMWRASRNAIPTKKNLQLRCVVDDPLCRLCLQHEENVLHALWSCLELAQVWNEDNQWSFKDRMTFHGFPQLLLHVLNSKCSVELFAMQVWTVWFRRNKGRTTPPGFPLNMITQRTYEALMEYRAAQQRTISTRSSVKSGARWSPPHDDWYKANFDAATFQED